jgi:hypothetical protein
VQELFLNGNLVANRTSTGSLNTGTSVFDIGSGVNTSWGSDYFNGQIADVQIYNTALSASQIQALYQEGIGGAPINLQNLVGWWPLNGNSKDYSGYRNNGTANNIAYPQLTMSNPNFGISAAGIISELQSLGLSNN